MYIKMYVTAAKHTKNNEKNETGVIKNNTGLGTLLLLLTVVPFTKIPLILITNNLYFIGFW